MNRSSLFWNWTCVSPGWWEGHTKKRAPIYRKARVVRLPGYLGWVHQSPPMPAHEYWIGTKTLAAAFRQIDAGTPQQFR